MGNIFLGPLKADDYKKIKYNHYNFVTSGIFVSSGANALRLLIRSLNLKKKSRIAIPALICSSVARAIKLEKKTPAFTDISSDNYFMLFQKKNFDKEKYNLIVLPHMYGILHPQTEEIINYAKENNIPLIHDCAQSYGVLYEGRPIVEFNEGGFYSFGAGKSTTAASGGLVFGIKKELIEKYNLFSFKKKDLFSENFLKERCGLNYFKYFYYFLSKRFQASQLQVNAASYVLNNYEKIEKRRKINFNKLKNILPEDIYEAKKLKRFSYYKYIFYSKHKLFIEKEYPYLPVRTVYFPERNSDSIQNYNKFNGFLYEVSTERSFEEYKEINS
ncbi:MAG: DegT/DnrJ/EryC1/StrS family aminotransferase [Spirochaetia bacterium]|nr:DegT/DnrJ/EryC1/StrS family aminotransferase [Spirochaetia bacterium]